LAWSNNLMQPFCAFHHFLHLHTPLVRGWEN
jgi:hypothetical protein